ncbi:single-stranded DNA-binding protein [Variovorax guangxiensis]|uniref:Single-stranded DNA-binding protein n=1 Tax=Variovorax guangxiensis TaxID=1775474 RepID=A0A433MMH7_9BURK|nr:ERF family protein [Variovorax guangxiensis]RUR69038.1 single-stranded DNA-binding protein [Variovorax guangxiensis]
MQVYKAINSVQAALAKVGISKANRNQQQGYNFRGIDDVYNTLSPLLAENGLCILPRVLARTVDQHQTSKGGTLFYVTVEAEFDFVCAEDGSKHTVKTFGEAMDSGDKATNKAMSAAYKYAAMQAFAIPTEGDNDADATTHEVAGRKAPNAKDDSPKARAQRITAGVTAGDATGAAAAMAGWDEPLRDSVWALLPAKTQQALTAVWPQGEPA